MSRTILQVPVNATLRREAERQALSQGFSSLQEAVRIFLKKLARGVIGITFEDEEAIQLSPRAIKRYEKIMQDIKSGKEKVYRAKNVKDLMLQLNS
jgi:antitoxin component of RelBE/YafQ-DinJ toxin-antitoxin module